MRPQSFHSVINALKCSLCGQQKQQQKQRRYIYQSALFVTKTTTPAVTPSLAAARNLLKVFNRGYISLVQHGNNNNGNHNNNIISATLLTHEHSSLRYHRLIYRRNYARTSSPSKGASCTEPRAMMTPSYSKTSLNVLREGDQLRALGAIQTKGVRFTVQLTAALAGDELLAVTGSTPELGEWQLEHCVALREHEPTVWVADVVLDGACSIVKYRYLIYVRDKLGRRQIRRWETDMRPRKLEVAQSHTLAVSDKFGVIENAAKPNVKRGWLTTESVVHLKFNRPDIFRSFDCDKFNPDNLLIKVVQLVEGREDDLTSRFDAGVNVEVAKYTYGESQLRQQEEYGELYKRSDIVLFHCTVPNPNDISFVMLFSTRDSCPVGKAIIRNQDLAASEGTIKVSVLELKSSGGKPLVLAHLSLPYLIIRPYVGVPLNFRTTYAHYWPSDWPYLDVGHRGNGCSFKANGSAELENSLASFRRAYNSHADMVELDVHLTADLVPIVYHNFGIHTAPHGAKISGADQLHFLLIKDVTYEALKNMRIFIVIAGDVIELLAHNQESRYEHRLFPHLRDVFNYLPKSCGIDVEIKWPQMQINGSPEAADTHDKNVFVDVCITTVITYGIGRAIVFSCFDADVCAMIRFKQNIFPVIFLTMGRTCRWDPYMDLRTRSYLDAVNHAQAVELAGTAAHAEELLDRNTSDDFIQKARNLGQITLVWGEDCNDATNARKLVQMGANAICYDRIDLLITRHKRQSFFCSPGVMELFQDPIDN